MIRVLTLLALATPAVAADRTVGIGSFDRLRVDGPFDVRVTGGASPRATLTGDREAIDAVEVRLEGGTLVVRSGVNAWGERRTDRQVVTGPVVVTLATPVLSTVIANAGAGVMVSGMKGDRVELSVTGAGMLTVAAAQATDLNATLVGNGSITVAGRATRTRLLANGAGRIDAGSLDAGDALVRLEGVGEIDARARYTAQVSNPGLGTVKVAGSAKCIIRGATGGPIRCEGRRG